MFANKITKMRLALEKSPMSYHSGRGDAEKLEIIDLIISRIVDDVEKINNPQQKRVFFNFCYKQIKKWGDVSLHEWLNVSKLFHYLILPDGDLLLGQKETGKKISKNVTNEFIHLIFNGHEGILKNLVFLHDIVLDVPTKKAMANLVKALFILDDRDIEINQEIKSLISQIFHKDREFKSIHWLKHNDFDTLEILKYLTGESVDNREYKSSEISLYKKCCQLPYFKEPFTIKGFLKNRNTIQYHIVCHAAELERHFAYLSDSFPEQSRELVSYKDKIIQSVLDNELPYAQSVLKFFKLHELSFRFVGLDNLSIHSLIKLLGISQLAQILNANPTINKRLKMLENIKLECTKGESPYEFEIIFEGFVQYLKVVEKL